MVFFIVFLLLSWGLGSCGRVYIRFNTPNVPPAPCPIRDLLLDVSAFLGNGWEETGSRSERGASVRMGIERIGTSFLGPVGGVFQEIYRYEDERQASRAFEDSAESWYTPMKDRTEWATPREIENLAVNADHYRVGCNNLKSGGFEQCQYVAHYGSFIIRFFAGMRSLSYGDFIELVKKIDQQAISCQGKNR